MAYYAFWKYGQWPVLAINLIIFSIFAFVIKYNSNQHLEKLFALVPCRVNKK